MSATDRNHSQSSSQSESKLGHFKSFDFIQSPVCIRDAHGNFVYFNDKFKESIKGTQFSCERWFSLLPVELQYGFVSNELTAFNDRNIAATIEVIIEMHYHWYVLFESFTLNSQMYVVWRFFNKIMSSKVSANDGLKKIALGKNAIDPMAVLEPGYLQVFCLYFSGFSHEFISTVLGITTTTSKKRVSKIYSRFGVFNRDDMIVYMHSNQLYVRVNQFAIELIKNNVEKLL